MYPKNGFSRFLVIITLGVFFLSLAFYFYSVQGDPLNNSTVPEKESVLIEKIPGSKFHSPDGTWWGYNQEKIVRSRNFIFTYFIENHDDSNKTSSNFVLLKKEGDSKWEQGAKFQTSRPGNILIDSTGTLHAFVFEPFDVTKNDSWGKLIHYWFPNAVQGDITNYQEEVIVDNDGTNETANIRVGASYGKDDTMTVSFGLTKFNPNFNNQSEHVYFKKPNEKTWNHKFVDGLQHDYFYPFTLTSSENSFYLLPIQDDFTGVDNPNIYQKIMFFEYTNNAWKNELVADLTTHKLASTKPRLLEQEDFFLDKNGQIHILYKEFLDSKSPWQATSHYHLSGSFGNWSKEKINFDQSEINWVKFIEIEEKLYYLATSFDSLSIGKANTTGKTLLTKIPLPPDALSMYPYVATAKNGSTNSKYVDILLLCADQKLFLDGKNTNYYVRIPKTEFK